MRKWLWLPLLCSMAFAQGTYIGQGAYIGTKAQVYQGALSGGGTAFALDGAVHGVQDNNTTASSSALLVLGTPTLNDDIVCEVTFSNAASNAFTSVTDNVNAGVYTALVAVHQNTTIGQWVGIYYHTGVAHSATTVTLAYTVANQFGAIACQAFIPGSAATNTIDGTIVQRDLTATANPTVAAGTTTPAGANELVICNLITSTNTPTAGTNFTRIDAATNTLMWPEYWTQTTATAVNCPYTNLSDNWTDQQGILK